jgi:hypothetical protein
MTIKNFQLLPKIKGLNLRLNKKTFSLVMLISFFIIEIRLTTIERVWEQQKKGDKKWGMIEIYKHHN